LQTQLVGERKGCSLVGARLIAGGRRRNADVVCRGSCQTSRVVTYGGGWFCRRSVRTLAKKKKRGNLRGVDTFDGRNEVNVSLKLGPLNTPSEYTGRRPHIMLTGRKGRGSSERHRGKAQSSANGKLFRGLGKI